METKEVRKLIGQYGEFCSFATAEFISDDTPSSHADNYICYTELVEAPKTVTLPPVQFKKPRLSFMQDYAGYLEYGNHIPIPCFDFFVRTSDGTKDMYLLIKRGIWPMYGCWWPVGGRRLLPDYSGPIQPYWTRAHEIVRKLSDDLGLRPSDILGISKIASSDHYHLAYENVLQSSYAQRRMTPVTSYVVDICPDAANNIEGPYKEALEARWFSSEELIRQLNDGGPEFPDHLRVILAVTLRSEFQLQENDDAQRRIA